jgi:hypothetical protein
MSIKTIGSNVQSNSAGLQKRINKSAEKLVFDVLQSTQYSTPIPSTVRELVTNACDSQREKEIALEILSGKKKVEDYYITRNDDQYVDSNFNPDYYDSEYLSDSNNRVTVRYKENDGTGYCDVFSVIDYGVGIGESRLEGYLELGFSTKRNTAENFGAFGLGAKVPLSTGVDFYTVETAHNGKLFKMNCFAYKTDFLVGKFQADGHITFSDGTQVNYIKTNEPNFTKISFGVKRHNRQKFIDAVQDQLNYIDNVDMKYVYEDGTEMDRSVRSDVLYNSDNLIISDTWAWRKPHIVMVKSPGATTGINYGYVDFRELEMEQLWGAVGIKCPARQAYLDEEGNEIVIQDGVEVTPSREKVIWNEHTKKYIQGAIERAAQDAANVINEQLDEDDFLTWVKKCSEVIYKNTGNDSVLRQLGEMVDKENIKPKFHTGITFASPGGILKGYKVRNVSKVWKNGKYHIEREEVGWGQVNWDNLYFVQGNPSATKDLYLMQNGTLTLITEHHPTNVYNDPKVQAKIDSINLNRVSNWELIKDSPMVKFDYEEIEVPANFDEALEKQQQQEDLKNRYRWMTPEERRREANEVVLYTLRRPHSGDGKWCNHISDWTWDKVEAPLQLIQDTDIETYYGTSEDEAMLQLAATICAPTVPNWTNVYPKFTDWHPYSNTDAQLENRNPVFTEFRPHRFRNDYNGNWMSQTDEEPAKVTDIQLFKVSAALSKKMVGDNIKHISEFFSVLHENKWSMHSKVREWVTGCMMPHVPIWFEKLKEVDPKYKDVLDKLRPYNKYRNHRHYWDRNDGEFKEIVDLMKKMHEMQVFILDGHDEQAIAQKSMELFKVADADCTIAEDDIHILGQYIDEFLEPLYPLFERINFPHYYHTDSVEADDKFWKEIRAYLELKDRHQFNPPL